MEPTGQGVAQQSIGVQSEENSKGQLLPINGHHLSPNTPGVPGAGTPAKAKFAGLLCPKA
ncbi:hypothetical protein AAY473_002457 [Plecturocebus cupreus]